MSTPVSTSADDPPVRPAPPAAGGPLRPGAPLPSLRRAAPALLAYAATRVIGVVILVVWGRRHGVPALHRLSVLWDAQYYQKIAQLGYAAIPPVPGPHGNYEMYAYFPAYPALIRAVATVLPVSYPAAALISAWAASLVAAWGIFSVAEQVYSRRVGIVTTVLWGVGPVAAVESMAYSELLFTACAAWAVYAVLTQRWLLAGSASVLAGLTRPTGSAVAEAVALAALWELWRRRAAWRSWWRPALGGLVAPLGFAGYIAWVGLVKGRLDAYFRIQAAWDSRFDFGRSTLNSFASMITGPGQVWLADVVVAFTLLAAVVLLGISVIQRQPPVLLLFSAAMLVLAIGDAAYFNCRARFLLPAFGLLLPLASGLVRVRQRAALVFGLLSLALVSGCYGGYLVFVYGNAP